jgi:transcriptional/translational regulatory protein YebC/TACO1
VGPEELSAKAREFKELGYEIHEMETIWSPLSESQLQFEANSQQANSLQKVIDDLGTDEVTGVYSNATVA